MTHVSHENLYKDVITHIYNFIPYLDRNITTIICTDFNHLYNIDITRIKRLQSFYRRKRIPDIYLRVGNICLNKNTVELLELEQETTFTYPLDYEIWSAKLLYRFFIAKYPANLLEQYISNLTKTLTNNYSTNYSNKVKLINWIDEHKNEIKNRRYLRNLFNDNDISVKNIMYSGW
jgi:hypothetical protein